jgi:SAM-dependent methyltransferase
MDKNAPDAVKAWYNQDYFKAGFKAQRNYPNEELLRFMGRNYFQKEGVDRSRIKILEAGCGSCANLWMIAKEGFDAFGLDLSAEALKLGEQRLQFWKVKAKLSEGNMTQLPYPDLEFDVVLDVFSSFCLNMEGFRTFVREVARTLKPGGRFFMYTPSIESDAFKNYAPAVKLDEFTLNGIYRKDSPYYGDFYNFRFAESKWLGAVLKEAGFRINQEEQVIRTYQNGKEKFQFMVLEAEKCN